MSYVSEQLEQVIKLNPGEPEFQQTVTEVLTSLEPVFNQNPQYEKAGIIERITEPERQIKFRVPWVDDNGKVQVNRGYRVQFNGSIGPFKGGLRFHPSVNISIIKFLGFEQIFKNSLTGLPIGGGKGGSDFDPRGKSDGEIMRFCQSFMTELYRHIGPDVDVPAGDIGVGAREIGYLYGQYKKITGTFDNGVLTGKGLAYGGSLIRPEATGYGAVYFCKEVLNHFGEDIKGKTFAVSGFGNVSWGAVEKITQLGGKVVTISGPDGYVYDEDGVSGEKIDYMLEMRASGRDKVQDYADKYNVPFFPGEKPWNRKVDVIMPCATQNEIGMEEAKQIVANGVKYYIEVSNMPTTNEALEYLKANNLVIAPSKAVNAGGVAVSALEMSQNSMRYSWSKEEVDEKLRNIMINIHNNARDAAAECGLGYDLVAGANIAGFKKVADAMLAQGI
ncbi:MAG: NADP-specific glutamate dehydrogenase [Clostridiales bacterium]|jgi:glutamate dehydrogenase (NADP+)|nr:NADP-specific glutamate dehydrogenase [Clostridiales bacterium]